MNKSHISNNLWNISLKSLFTYNLRETESRYENDVSYNRLLTANKNIFVFNSQLDGVNINFDKTLIISLKVVLKCRNASECCLAIAIEE